MHAGKKIVGVLRLARVSRVYYPLGIRYFYYRQKMAKKVTSSIYSLSYLIEIIIFCFNNYIIIFIFKIFPRKNRNRLTTFSSIEVKVTLYNLKMFSWKRLCAISVFDKDISVLEGKVGYELILFYIILIIGQVTNAGSLSSPEAWVIYIYIYFFSKAQGWRFIKIKIENT